jgi:hypothetical protein
MLPEKFCLRKIASREVVNFLVNSTMEKQFLYPVPIEAEDKSTIEKFCMEAAENTAHLYDQIGKTKTFKCVDVSCPGTIKKFENRGCEAHILKTHKSNCKGFLANFASFLPSAFCHEHHDTQKWAEEQLTPMPQELKNIINGQMNVS